MLVSSDELTLEPSLTPARKVGVLFRAWLMDSVSRPVWSERQKRVENPVFSPFGMNFYLVMAPVQVDGLAVAELAERSLQVELPACPWYFANELEAVGAACLA